MGQTFETETERAAFQALIRAGIAPEKAATLAKDPEAGETGETGDNDPPKRSGPPGPAHGSAQKSPAADALPGAAEFGAALEGIGRRLDRLEETIRGMGWDL